MGSVNSAAMARNNERKSYARRDEGTRNRAVRLRETLFTNNNNTLQNQVIPAHTNGHKWTYPAPPATRVGTKDVSNQKSYQNKHKQKLENLLTEAMQQNTSHGLHQLLTRMSIVVKDLQTPSSPRRPGQRNISQRELSSLPPIPTLPEPLQSDLATPRASGSKGSIESEVPTYPASLKPLPNNVKAVILSFAFHTETVNHISEAYRVLASKHNVVFVPDYKGVQVNDAGEPDANGWYQRLDPTVARPMRGFFANNPEAWAHFIQGRPLFRKDDGYYIRYSAASPPIASHSSSSSAGSFWSLIDPEGNSLYHVKSTRKMPPEYGWKTQEVCRTRRVDDYSHMTVNVAARRHRGLDYIEEGVADYSKKRLKNAGVTRKSYPDEIKPWDGYFQNEDNCLSFQDSGCIEESNTCVAIYTR